MQRRTFLRTASAGVGALALPGLGRASGTRVSPGAAKLEHRIGYEHLIFGPDGSSYVLDPMAHSVSRVTQRRRRTVNAAFTEAGVQHDEVNFPVDAAVSQEGRLFVVDHGNDQISIFDPNGRPITQVEGLRNPRGVVVLRSGLVAACDTGHHAVLLFDQDGAPKAHLAGGRPNAFGMGELNAPCAIAEDPKGNLHVVDSGNCRVAVMSPKGKLEGTYGGHGWGQGELHMPRAIAIDSKGRACIGEAATGRIHVFGRGRFMERFQVTDGYDNPVAPLELSFDPDGQLYVWASDEHGPMPHLPR